MMLVETSEFCDAKSVTFARISDANGNITEYVQFQGSNFTFQVSTVAHYEYSPFGQVTFQSGEMADSFMLRYSSKYADTETGLTYFNYRYYDRDRGRFINYDPLYGDAMIATILRKLKINSNVLVAEKSNLLLFARNSPIYSNEILGLGRWIPEANCKAAGACHTVQPPNLEWLRTEGWSCSCKVMVDEDSPYVDTVDYDATEPRLCSITTKIVRGPDSENMCDIDVGYGYCWIAAGDVDICRADVECTCTKDCEKPRTVYDYGQELYRNGWAGPKSEIRHVIDRHVPCDKKYTF
jgi:RHS repeat-associated protein